MEGKVCCFLGHKKIDKSDELRKRLYNTIEELITQENADTFLFGSKSEFDDLCYETVSELKKKYRNIRRIYVRAEYQYINESYMSYLLSYYEYSYYSVSAAGATKAVYIKRNREMIDKSDFCVIYFLDEYKPDGRKSGTRQAYEYAIKQKKTIYRFP